MVISGWKQCRVQKRNWKKGDVLVLKDQEAILAGVSYKYVHIFLDSLTGFNLKLVNLICDPDNGFHINEHLFVTSFRPLYDKVKDMCHIEWCENPGHHGVDMINLYGDYADWLIVHSFPIFAHCMIFQVKKKYLKKMLWRTWGHDVGGKYVRFWSQNPVKNYILKIYGVVFYINQRCLYFLTRRRMKSIYAVGIANVIDAINVKEYYGLTKTCWMPYPEKGEYEILKKLLNEKSFNDGYYHVMVGHSASSLNRHCEVIDLLKPFENEKMVLHLVLSYAGEGYVWKVKKYVKDFWNGKVEILENKMDYEMYAKYVNRMDAVILDGVLSYALGNLSMVLFLKKKIFLNRNGVLQKGMNAENIYFHYTDEIKGMSFTEFSTKEIYTLPNESTLAAQPYEEAAEAWRKIFRALEKDTLKCGKRIC